VPSSSSCPYGLALVALHKDDTRLALVKLREAVDRKMPHPDTLADDPALARLKQVPEFLTLAASASAKP
jgi:hypothetical protein